LAEVTSLQSERIKDVLRQAAELDRIFYVMLDALRKMREIAEDQANPEFAEYAKSLLAVTLSAFRDEISAVTVCVGAP
jgi:hypothetical protein